jgi:hypothetical protein
MTLLEVLVATAVLMIGGLSVLSLLSDSMKTHVNARDEHLVSLLGESILTDVELSWNSRWADKNEDGYPDIFNWLDRPSDKSWPIKPTQTLPVPTDKFKYRIRYYPLEGEGYGVTMVHVDILVGKRGKDDRVTTFFKMIMMR